jgi:hypothetical protein
MGFDGRFLCSVVSYLTNVSQRAQELIAVGQAQAALSLLHEHVTSKRSRNSPITSLEPVMILFVELCVDLRKGKSAKDGLYQYKNIAQNTNVGTIEVCHPGCFDGKTRNALEKTVGRNLTTLLLPRWF